MWRRPGRQFGDIRALLGDMPELEIMTETLRRAESVTGRLDRLGFWTG